MSENTRTRFKLAADAGSTIARVGLTLTRWAELADVSYATVKALRNPSQQPNRKGGMHAITAWKLARAYAGVAQIDEDTAFKRLIVEEPIEENAA